MDHVRQRRSTGCCRSFSSSVSQPCLVASTYNSGSSLPRCLQPSHRSISPDPQLSHRHHVDFDPAVFVCLRHHAEPVLANGRGPAADLFYYPIAISKTALFAPAWLMVMWGLSRLFGAGIAVVLSLLLRSWAGSSLLPFSILVRALPGCIVVFLQCELPHSCVPSLAI